MVFQCKPVGLVPDPLKEFEGRRPGRQHHHGPIFQVEFIQALGQPDQPYLLFDAQDIQGLAGGPHLADAAIDQNQSGQVF